MSISEYMMRSFGNLYGDVLMRWMYSNFERDDFILCIVVTNIVIVLFIFMNIHSIILLRISSHTVLLLF